LKNTTLRDAGLKVTGPRLKILNLLGQPGVNHLSAEDVHKKLLLNKDDVSLATVYRVLAQFEAAGLVLKHSFEDKTSVFELDNGEHHDHMVCSCCGLVLEFVDQIIEQRQQIVADQFGFIIADHDLTIYGVCKECHSNSNSS
jgi:Fur family transcriptional regulator, ferric uptake regulator